MFIQKLKGRGNALVTFNFAYAVLKYFERALSSRLEYATFTCWNYFISSLHSDTIVAYLLGAVVS